jgi:hypothetical protein
VSELAQRPVRRRGGFTGRRSVVSGLAALLLLGGCVAVNFGEAELLRPRPGPALAAEAARGAGYAFDALEVPARDGALLRGALLRRPGAKTTVIFFGGNIATAARTGLRRAREFAPLGVNLVLVDYRGYGASDAGPMTAESLLSDGLAVFDHVAARTDVDPRTLVVHGHSMGSLIAAHVAAMRATAGVVLESSVTTTDAFVENKVPWYARLFVRIAVAEPLRRQGNLARMAQIEEPLLLIVGENDRETPVRFAHELHAASPLPPDRRRLVVVPGAGHADVFGQPLALEAYREFLRAIGAGPSILQTAVP